MPKKLKGDGSQIVAAREVLRAEAEFQIEFLRKNQYESVRRRLRNESPRCNPKPTSLLVASPW
jgi:hypothetical protein